MARNFQLTLASLLVAVGLLVSIVGAIAIVDPVGTQHANDADPFGSPPSIIRSTVTLLLGCALVFGGVRVLRRPRGQ